MPLNPGHISMGNGIRNHETGEASYRSRYYDTLAEAREAKERDEHAREVAMEMREEDRREREAEHA